MIIKILGSTLIIMSTTFLGFYYSYVETYREKDLEEFKKALNILKSEMTFTYTPLTEAIKNVAMKTSSPVNKIMYSFYENLEKSKNEDIDLNLLWETAFMENKKYCYFNEEDITEILSFGKTLGYLDVNMQVGNIENLNAYIDSKLKGINSHKDETKKMYQSLSILSGLLFVIVLF